MSPGEHATAPRRLAHIYDWPRWVRRMAMTASYAVMLGGFWLMVKGSLALRVIGVLAFALSIPLTLHLGRAAMKERSRPVDRRYAREFMLAMVGYTVIMLYVWPLHVSMAPGALQLATVLLPVLPIAWVIVASIRYVLGSDEMERRQHLEALAIGVAIVSLISMLLGFLVAGKLMTLDSGMALLLVYPALCLTYGAARCWLVCRSGRE